METGLELVRPPRVVGGSGGDCGKEESELSLERGGISFTAEAFVERPISVLNNPGGECELLEL